MIILLAILLYTSSFYNRILMETGFQPNTKAGYLV